MFELRFSLKGSTRVGDTTIPGDSVWLMVAEADMQPWEGNRARVQAGVARKALARLARCVPLLSRSPARLQRSGDREPAADRCARTLHVGNPVTAKKVDQLLNELNQAFADWTPVANDGGAALKTAVTSWVGSPADTACEKLKAE